MHELTLTWAENNNRKNHTIYDQQPSKNPVTVRIGRDPARCDIVLNDPTLTVSGLHVEIFFNPQQHSFYLRSLRSTNPPIVDGQTITQGEVPLKQGSTINLGKMTLTVVAVYLSKIGVPATIVLPSSVTQVVNPAPAPPQIPQPLPVAVNQSPAQTTPSYGLRCSNSKCGKTSPYSRLALGCPWCGTSLAAAGSVLISVNGS